MRTFPCRHVRRVFVLPVVMILAALTFATLKAEAGETTFAFPAEIDPHGRYLFFLHNYYVEMFGTGGECKYDDILKSLQKTGAFVISEVRSGHVIPSEYARIVSSQVEKLIAAGVAPKNITVSGHSKGGVIALCVAAQLQRPDIGYVIMAGCGISSLSGAYPLQNRIRGNYLSLLANSDTVAGSCDTLRLRMDEGASYKEIVLESDFGHRLFFEPRDIWLAPVIAWINKR